MLKASASAEFIKQRNYGFFTVAAVPSPKSALPQPHACSQA